MRAKIGDIVRVKEILELRPTDDLLTAKGKIGVIVDISEEYIHQDMPITVAFIDGINLTEILKKDYINCKPSEIELATKWEGAKL